MKDILFIMGQPNVGKTALINKLMATGKFELPIHYTNRPPRKDDKGFYEYVNEQFFTEKNMFLWASDKYGRYYGVQKFDLHSKSKKTFIVNCSIKNISQIINLKRLYGKSMKICVLLSRDPISKVKNSHKKYSAEETEYRVQETLRELVLLNQYASEIEDSIFYCEDYIYFNKIIKQLKS